MEYVIRPAAKEDLETCEFLLNSPEFNTADGEKWTSVWLSNYIDDNFFLIAEFNNKIVGCIVGEKLKFNGSIIWLLGVDSTIRSRGIGSALLKKFEENVKKRDCEWVLIYANMHNDRTLNFYEKNLYCRGEKFTEYLKRL